MVDRIWGIIKYSLFLPVAVVFFLDSCGSVRATSSPVALKVSDYPGVIMTNRVTRIKLQYQLEEGADKLGELYFWLDEEAPLASHTWASGHGVVKKGADGYRYYGTRYNPRGTETCPPPPGQLLCEHTCCYKNYDWTIGGFLAGSTDKIYFSQNQADPSDLVAPSGTTTGEWRLLSANTDTSDPTGKTLSVVIELTLHNFFANKTMNFYLAAKTADGIGTNPFWSQQTSDVLTKDGITVTTIPDHPPHGLPRVPRYDKFELSFDGLLSSNPYDPDIVDIWADITSPSGKSYRQNAFAYTEFERGEVNVPTPDYCNMYQQNKWKNDYFWNPGNWDKMENLTSVKKEWRLRFAPDEIGTWQYQLKMKDASGQIEIGVEEFEAYDTGLGGPIQVSTTDSSYLEDRKGNFFFGLGFGNNCLETIAFANPDTTRWCRGTYIFEEQLQELANNKMNVIRLGPGENWGFSFEWFQSGLGNYDGRQKQAWALDHVIDYAKQRNVYVIPVFEAQMFFEHPNPDVFNEWQWNPYNTANGGPLISSWDFWNNQDAITYYKQKLRYLSARYFYNWNILFYEFWNETQVDPGWLQDMYDYVNSATISGVIKQPNGYIFGPHKRLLTLSYHGLGGDTTIPNFKTVDVANWHFYGCPTIYGFVTPSPAPTGTFTGCPYDQINGALVLYNYLNNFVKNYIGGITKPIGVTELGLLANEAAGSDYSLNCTYDNNCNTVGQKCCYQADQWRQSLWTILMAKGATIAPWYWWLPHNNKPGYSYQVFKTLADFMEGEDLRGAERFIPETSSPGNKLISFGLKKTGKVLIWTENTDSDWLKMMKENVSPVNIPDVSGGSLNLPDLPRGHYQLKMYNTQSGDILENKEIAVGDHGISLPLPAFNKDIATKLTFLAQPMLSLYPGWNRIIWPDISGETVGDALSGCIAASGYDKNWFSPYRREYLPINSSLVPTHTYFFSCRGAGQWQL